MKRIYAHKTIAIIIENCKNLCIGEPYQYRFSSGKSLIIDLWGDELTIRLEDDEGYEIESQSLDYYNMTKKDLEETVLYIWNCAERETV